MNRRTGSPYCLFSRVGLSLNRAICLEQEDGDATQRKLIEIIVGDFFLAYAPIESEIFMRLPDELMNKYHCRFKYPKQFFSTENGIKAALYRPKRDESEC